MPLELGVWRIDEGLKEIAAVSMDKENRLEDILAQDISIASPNWMIVGRQVRTPYGGYIDLLAIDRDGKLVVLELKRDKTPREVVAQLLDYASWVKELRDDDISVLFETYQEKYLHNGAESLDAAFCSRFGVDKMPDTINDAHELVVVASALDDSTERIINYLSETHGVAVNAVFFRVFLENGREYLTRAWFRDPTGAQIAPEEAATGKKWNGEYYVSFGTYYDWEKGRKYGYLIAGGGQWYSRTLSLLKDGARVWAYSPGSGYVGVGIVADSTLKLASNFCVEYEGKSVPLSTLPDVDPRATDNLDKPAEYDYLVRINWIKTLPVAEAIKEKGFFGNQNSVCMPKVEKWSHTVKRLKKRFGIRD